MTKLSDFVIDFLSQLGVKHIFVIQGGAVAHLIDSIAKNKNIEYITCQHEQACAMAADGYSRTGNSIGVAIATSGPGATNLITGIANAYYDSIPVLFITGNVASFRQSDKMGVRQYGFQETDIVSITKSITKYSIRLENPLDIKYELTKALDIAHDKRKGPVLIDIPDDFQRVLINPQELKTFSKELLKNEINVNMEKIEELLKKSQRPVFVFGNGVLSSNTVSLAKQISNKFNIPSLFSWPLKGMFSYNDKLNFGSFGTNSLRSGNFIIQNSDLIIAIGHRLDTHATGNISSFAREAKIILNDVDQFELNKFDSLGKMIDIQVCMDCKDFLEQLFKLDYKFNDDFWLNYCTKLKNKYYDVKIKSKNISPKYFFEKLSEKATKDTIFVGDTGANLVYLFNGIKEKFGQKFISAFNNTPMGFSIAASIGIALANKNKKIICCIGDGGLQMNIQELATIAYYKLPIIIFVFNNSGHGMIKQTQDDWLKSSYEASSSKKGIPKLNFKNISKAYGLKSFRLKNNSNIKSFLNDLLFEEPILVELIIDEKLRIDPMLQYGRPIEDMNPLLPRDEFNNRMIIKPLKISERK